MASCQDTKEKLSESIHLEAGGKHHIEASELKEIIFNDNIVVIDFRKPDEYEKGHIEGALNVWRSDIENNDYSYGGMMANHTQVEALMRRLGIEQTDTIVVYDNRGMADAARFWWVLKNYDIASVKLLNGGLEAWKQHDGTISKTSETPVPSKFEIAADLSQHHLLITKEELKTLIASDDPNLVIIDTRTRDEYDGKIKKEGASKAGRIPKSIHIDWAEAIDHKGTKKFKPLAELEKVYGTMGVTKTDPIVVYCHSGSRSAHTTFVLTELLGYSNVRNYDGSWIEWSYYDDLPYEKNNITMLNK